MKKVRTHISVAGFTKAEAEAGIPDLLDELRNRSYIARGTVLWNDQARTVDIQIDMEGDDLEAWGKFAEKQAWDCVIACINFSSPEIKLTTTKTELISEPPPGN